MPDLWMPGAARHSIGNTGAMDGGPARAVWHITSNSKDWTFANELGWFTGGGASVAPHLLWDPFTGEIAQFFPADSRALALQNAGDVRTNRTGRYCVQIEIVFTENETVNGKRYATVRDTPCNGLDKIMAWLRSLGITDTWPGGAPTGFARDTVAMDTWQTRGGHYGHNQIPGNSHVDPGPMPNLFTTGPTNQEDDMTPEQAKQLKELHDVLYPYAGWDYEGKGETSDAYAYLRGTSAAVKSLTAQVGALTATVGKLAAGGGLDAAEVQAAAEAGAKAALEQLGDALKEG
ncbi:hypothetical protein [Streptomyces sp. NRRL S-813]|uniref:hypothetical protein n=1 Tax=Streptomyces sp. NRRL S-813 TaxID=1463919 RepID=UPI0006892DDC|nr:hypothetical protein [Streptomyces sp. NRRL S-813]